MTDINKQKFLAELGKLLTFMYDEDRQDALAAYSRMFDNARDEQLLLQFLVSPTRQAVIIARAYNARERKLQVNSQSREGHIDDAASRDYMHVLDELEAQAVEHNIIVPVTSEAQLSIFDAEGSVEEPAQAALTAEAVELNEDEPQQEAAAPDKVQTQGEAEPAQAAEAVTADANNESASEANAEAATESTAEAAQNPPPADEAAKAETAEDTAAPVNEAAAPETVELGSDDVDAFLSEFSICYDELSAGAPAEEAEAVQAASMVLDEGEGKADKRRAAKEEKAEQRRAAKDAKREAAEAKKPAAIGQRPARTDKPAPAPVKAGQAPESVEIATRKPVVPLLILYTIIAVPVVALCVLILLIPTLLCLAVSALAVLIGCATLTSAFSAFTMFSDVMVVLGASLLTLALGLLFLWLFVWLIGGAIAGLINAIIKLGGKWCYKEVPTV